MKKRIKKQNGQAAVEFIIVVVVVFFFLLFYLSLCMGMVLSEYVEYATFMSARTLKAATVNYEQGQKATADQVFRNYFYFNGRQDQPIFPETLLKINNLNIGVQGPRDQKTAGVSVQYEVPLFYMPPIFLPPPPDAGTNGVPPLSRLQLTAESYLGREPTLDEVRDDLGRLASEKKLKTNTERFLNQMDDNGF